MRGMSGDMMLILFLWGVFVVVVMLLMRKLMGGKGLDGEPRKPPE